MTPQDPHGCADLLWLLIAVACGTIAGTAFGLLALYLLRG